MHLPATTRENQGAFSMPFVFFEDTLVPAAILEEVRPLAMSHPVLRFIQSASRGWA